MKRTICCLILVLVIVQPVFSQGPATGPEIEAAKRVIVWIGEFLFEEVLRAGYRLFMEAVTSIPINELTDSERELLPKKLANLLNQESIRDAADDIWQKARNSQNQDEKNQAWNAKRDTQDLYRRAYVEMKAWAQGIDVRLNEQDFLRHRQLVSALPRFKPL